MELCQDAATEDGYDRSSGYDQIRALSLAVQELTALEARASRRRAGANCTAYLDHGLAHKGNPFQKAAKRQQGDNGHIPAVPHRCALLPEALAAHCSIFVSRRGIRLL